MKCIWHSPATTNAEGEVIHDAFVTKNEDAFKGFKKKTRKAFGIIAIVLSQRHEVWYRKAETLKDMTHTRKLVFPEKVDQVVTATSFFSTKEARPK